MSCNDGHARAAAGTGRPRAATALVALGLLGLVGMVAACESDNSPTTAADGSEYERTRTPGEVPYDQDRPTTSDTVPGGPSSGESRATAHSPSGGSGSGSGVTPNAY